MRKTDASYEVRVSGLYFKKLKRLQVTGYGLRVKGPKSGIRKGWNKETKKPGMLE